MTTQGTDKLHIAVQEAGSYFKGLLLLIGTDNTITDAEQELLMRVGKALGFEKEFCRNAIQEVLDNKYLVDSLPTFSSKEVVEKFVMDGLAIAAADGHIHKLEEQWLLATAKRYLLSEQWFADQKLLAMKRSAIPDTLQADSLVVDYSKKE